MRRPLHHDIPLATPLAAIALNIHPAFEEAVDAFEVWGEGEPEPTIEVDSESLTIPQICGRLWNDTNFMPNRVHSRIRDIIHDNGGDADGVGPHYSHGARCLKKLYQEAIGQDS